MDNLPRPFSDMLKGCTLLEKRAMLLALQNSIRSDERQTFRDIQTSKLPELVEYLPDFIPEPDVTFLANIIRELESIESLKPASDVRSQWLSYHGEAYHFGGKGYESMDLSQFTHIQTLMDMVNKSSYTTHDANSCLINFHTALTAVLLAAAMQMMKSLFHRHLASAQFQSVLLGTLFLLVRMTSLMSLSSLL